MESLINPVSDLISRNRILACAKLHITLVILYKKQLINTIIAGKIAYNASDFIQERTIKFLWQASAEINSHKTTYRKSDQL